MKDKYFLDTNIFLYSFDRSVSEKNKAANDLILRSIITGKGIISFQVVQEFSNVMTKKNTGITHQEKKNYLIKTLFPLWEIYPTRDLYLFANDIQERYQYSFYDSMIIAAALEGNCKLLYSEDLQNGQQIESLKIINPFRGI